MVPSWLYLNSETGRIEYLLHVSTALLLHFRDVEGMLHSANKTEFGLASGVFTRDISKVL